MKLHHMRHSILPFAMACAMCYGTTLKAAELDPQEAAIQKVAEGFVEAFHTGDAKAVAAFWAPDGDYVDLSGRVFNGRNAMRRRSQSSSRATKD